MRLPIEYVELLRAVINCISSDTQIPLRTSGEMTEWLHSVSPQAVEQAIAGHNHTLLAHVVQCVLQDTHDPRLSDWTPEQIASWCGRVRAQDVQLVLQARDRG